MSEVVPTELELVPEAESRFHQVVAVTVGFVAVLAALLAILEADSHRRNDLATARASLLTSDISTDIAASSSFTSFGLTSRQDALALALESTARRLATFGQPSVEAGEVPLADAEGKAASRASTLASTMGALPTTADGVDPFAIETLAATTAGMNALTKQQNNQVDRAERYAKRETRAILGLSLAASAAALLGLAGLLGGGRSGRLLLTFALLAMLGAIVSGAATFV